MLGKSGDNTCIMTATTQPFVQVTCRPAGFFVREEGREYASSFAEVSARFGTPFAECCVFLAAEWVEFDGVSEAVTSAVEDILDADERAEMAEHFDYGHSPTDEELEAQYAAWVAQQPEQVDEPPVARPITNRCNVPNPAAWGKAVAL